MAERRCGQCVLFVEVRKATRNIAAGGKSIMVIRLDMTAPVTP